MAIEHRLFFAAQPLEEKRLEIGRHRVGLAGLDYAVLNQHLHMTLAVTPCYDYFPAEVAHALSHIGATVEAEPISISLARLSASGQSVALCPVGRTCRALRALQKELAARMGSLGLLLPKYAFRPHVTLGYRQGKPFAWPIPPIAWENHEFVLIHSEVGATRHKVLGRWPLMWRQGRLF